MCLSYLDNHRGVWEDHLPINIIVGVSIDEESGEGGVGVDVQHHVQIILAVVVIVHQLFLDLQNFRVKKFICFGPGTIEILAHNIAPEMLSCFKK